MKEIGGHFGISHWTVLDRLEKVGVRKRSRHPIGNNKAFEVFDAPSCYWAGFIAADGFVARDNIAIELNSKDAEHLVKLCNLVQRDTCLWRRQRERSGKMVEYVQVSLNSKKVTDDLCGNFNIVPAKSKVLRPPDAIPQELVRHYIRGYVDGDGTIGWHKENQAPRLGIVSGSKGILEWIASKIKESGSSAGNPSIRKYKEANTYAIEWNGRYSIDIMDWLFEDSTPGTRLDRKYGRYIEYKERLRQKLAEQQSRK
jgi:hypothetical protein